MVPFWELYLGFCKLIPKRNYYGAYGSRVVWRLQANTVSLNIQAGILNDLRVFVASIP